jgi:hypothetical protein
MLRKEKFLFLTQTDPYDKDNAFHLLVQRVEGLLSKENTVWTQSMMKQLKKGQERQVHVPRPRHGTRNE